MGFLDRIKSFVLGPDLSKVPRPGGDRRGGVAGRAVIVDTAGALSGDDGYRSVTRVTWTAKRLTLHPVGDPARTSVLECYFDHLEWLQARPGTEIPVRLDPATGAVLGVDHDAFAAEVAGRPR